MAYLFILNIATKNSSIPARSGPIEVDYAKSLNAIESKAASERKTSSKPVIGKSVQSFNDGEIEDKAATQKSNVLADEGNGESEPAQQTAELENENVKQEAQFVQGYVDSVAELINEKKFYPDSARRRGRQGKVVVELKLNRVGETLLVRVLETSTYKDLDDAAIDSIRMIKAFPAFPREVVSNEILISVPIVFKLN